MLCDELQPSNSLITSQLTLSKLLADEHTQMNVHYKNLPSQHVFKI